MSTYEQLNTDRITMTGSEVEYVMPEHVRSISFKPIDGDVTVKANSASAAAWTIYQGSELPINAVLTAGKKLYFTGTNGHIVEIFIMKGLLD